jgi:bacteriocin biosynthesis cyclodehydratase domain-containing protein
VKAVHLLAIGSFGQAVADEMVTMLDPVPVRVVSPPGAANLPEDVSEAAELSFAATIVVLSGRPVPAITEWVDEVSFASGVPWLPVTVDSNVLRTGPLVVPGRSACYRCFQLRTHQHAANPVVELAVAGYYRGGSADEPYGYLPGTVALAASTATDAVDRALAVPASAAGQVRQRDLVSGRLASGTVVGIHGCSRCGLHRDERTRSTVDLHRAVGEVLAWAS